METDSNVDKVAGIVKMNLRDWRSPSGEPHVELQLLLQEWPAGPVSHTPWVRMSIDSSTELLAVLTTAIAGAQGVFETPSGPLN